MNFAQQRKQDVGSKALVFYDSVDGAARIHETERGQDYSVLIITRPLYNSPVAVQKT